MTAGPSTVRPSLELGKALEPMNAQQLTSPPLPAPTVSFSACYNARTPSAHWHRTSPVTESTAPRCETAASSPWRQHAPTRGC